MTDTKIRGGLDIAYAPDKHVVSLWFTPDGPRASSTRSGIVLGCHLTQMTASTDSLPNDVRQAITALYEAFARYALPASSSYSTHTSISEADVRALRSRPLQELTGRDLGKYAMKALTTWGDEDEFRHYLPRLLELLAVERSWTDAATLLGRLSTARWRSWPEAEQRAVEEYLAAISSQVVQGALALDLAAFALGVSNAGVGLAPLVNAWKATQGVEPLAQLANLVSLERAALLRDGTVGRHWSEDARRELGALLRADDTRRRFEEAFFQMKDPVQSEDVSFALGVLERMPRT